MKHDSRISCFSILALAVLVSACVPKTHYEDQEAKLKDAESHVKSLEQNQQECDPDTFIQLREQTQSLDVLTQELVERNTQLSNEVARLRPFEARFRDQENQCKKQTDEMRGSYEAQMQRTKATYEDLIRELEAKVRRLEDELQGAKKAPAPKKAAVPKPAAPKPAEKPAAPAPAKP